MNLANVNGKRCTAKPGLKGICLGCELPVIAKCGKIKQWHWSHKADSQCPLNKGETQWHRDWKNRFPTEAQEIFHLAENGERHFADVKTKNNWVLEFQHSPINDDELTARNDFYKQIAWVVHIYKKQELKNFAAALERGIKLYNLPELLIVEKKLCRQIVNWSLGEKPIFFDLDGYQNCWLMLPVKNSELAWFIKLDREQFTSMHLSEEGNDAFKRFLNVNIVRMVECLKFINKSITNRRPQCLSYRTVRYPRLSRRRRWL